MIPLSITILTRNEERVLERCLKSASWADEIVVIDAMSTDRTKEIATKSSAPWSGKLKWIERPWSGFKDQRNHALKCASHEWILCLDSDEECSEELRKRVLELLSSVGGPPKRAYKVRRQEYFLGKRIQYGIWNPSYQDRFFHKKGVYYVNDVHEYPIFESLPDRIHEPIYHDPTFNPDRFLHKMNLYTTIEAQDRINRGQRTSIFKLFFAFPAMFLKNYFYYKAYRDGVHGFVISLLEGVSRVVRHIKMWRIQSQARAEIALVQRTTSKDA